MRKSRGRVARRIIITEMNKRIMDKCRLRSAWHQLQHLSGRPTTVNKPQTRTLENQRRGRDTVSDRSLMIVRRFVYRPDWPRSLLTDRRKSRRHRLFEQVEHVRANMHEWANERTNEVDKCLLSLHTRLRYLNQCCNLMLSSSLSCRRHLCRISWKERDVNYALQ